MQSTTDTSHRRAQIQSSIELLETRIAPAQLLSPFTFSYTDVDGDNVVVKFTKPILTEANFDSRILLSNGGLAGTGAQSLSTLELAMLGAEFNGLGINIKSTPTKNFAGDGRIQSLIINAS